MKNELITENYTLNKEVVEQQFDLLYSFTRSLAYYRSIHKDLHRLEDNFEFFCHTMNAHILKAITQWCMVFGPDSNEVQWKKTPLSDHEFFIKDIRRLIYKSTGLTRSQWVSYHEKMISFRNCYVAHRNPKIKEPVPHLDNAFKVSIAYFDWLKKELWSSYDEPDSLNELYPKFENEALESYKYLLKKI